MPTSSRSVSQLDPYYEFREKLVEAVSRDLIGPYDDNEIIKDAPLTRYISGIIYPRSKDQLDPEEDNDASDADDDLAPDPPVALANVKYPSSLGFTFAVDLNATTEIEVEISTARYEQIEAPNGGAISGKLVEWKRIPLSPKPQPIAVTNPTPGQWTPICPGLSLFHRIRPSQAGISAVTVVLVNENIVTEDDKVGTRDALSFLQVQIKVAAPQAQGAPFVERRTSSLSVEDDDLESYRLLYRAARSFAVGHGCGTEWTCEDGGKRATTIRTSIMPRYEMQLADSNSEIPASQLSMQALGGEDWSTSKSALEQLCIGYEKWIEAQESITIELSDELKKTARVHLEGCRQALQRMREGILLLDSDPVCRRAFQLANLAMLKQRARTEWLKSNKATSEPAESRSITWRPFQIAFILLCLNGVSNPKSPDRHLADLLWFPTGGGKTEAYLGIIAFTIFLRRLRSNGQASGVTVLMRYTLRLLTIQQFERATLLIAACESLRRKYEGVLGKARISIGLWVGQNATPNSKKDCAISLKKLYQGKTLTTENPVQLQQCVWCGAFLDHTNYWQTSGDQRLIISCRQEGCEFAKGLPAFVVDEDIYETQPSLIIGTVDKFAALPWKADTASLFNIDNPDIPRPELIIQDELHLISGPLGTLTGLYETAVDALCTFKGAPPKVIASTATIRRAGSQTKALFDRDFRQFPPPAINASDSYFAREAPREEKGSRLYCGLLAPGTSHATLMIRTYSVLLQIAKDLPGADKVRDTYWTLLGYFNSLRVLGGAKLQVQDDVSDRLEYLASLYGTEPRDIDEPVELTSRVASAEIPANLKAIERRYPDKKTVSVVLATNMISVGVDVDRLGLMALMGQPQSTSEYIQSSSRIGRRYPGLVFTLYNAGRSRDRSHYENFVTYHSALYRQVESSSVTPFSPRARDRGLHAVIIALARLLSSKFRPNASATNVSDLERELSAVKEIVLNRAKNVLADDSEELQKVDSEINELIQRWKEETTDNDLVFSNYRRPRESLLVEAYEQHPDCVRRFKTLRSLRDVDKNSDLYKVKPR